MAENTPRSPPPRARNAPYNYPRFFIEYYALDDLAGPRAGETAPDFAATSLRGERIRLSSYLGQPLVLETGSQTCPMYTGNIERMNSLAKVHPGVTFLVLYVREVHPGERLRPHRTPEAKLAAARQLPELEPERRTLLVDQLDGAAHLAYGGLPNMVYLINPDGVVQWRSDWSDPDRLASLLEDYDPDRRDPHEHHRRYQERPPFAFARRVLMRGGVLAVLDALRSEGPKRRAHMHADEVFERTGRLGGDDRPQRG